MRQNVEVVQATYRAVERFGCGGVRALVARDVELETGLFGTVHRLDAPSRKTRPVSDVRTREEALEAVELQE